MKGRRHQGLLSLCTKERHVGIVWDGSCLQARKRGLPKKQVCSLLILNFSACRTVRKRKKKNLAETTSIMAFCSRCPNWLTGESSILGPALLPWGNSTYARKALLLFSSMRNKVHCLWPRSLHLLPTSMKLTR